MPLTTSPDRLQIVDVSCAGDDGTSITFALPWLAGAGVFFLGTPCPVELEGLSFEVELTGIASPNGNPIDIEAPGPAGKAMLGYNFFAGLVNGSATLKVTGLGADGWEMAWYVGWLPGPRVEPGQVVG